MHSSTFFKNIIVVVLKYQKTKNQYVNIKTIIKKYLSNIKFFITVGY